MSSPVIQDCLEVPLIGNQQFAVDAKEIKIFMDFKAVVVCKIKLTILEDSCLKQW